MGTSDVLVYMGFAVLRFHGVSYLDHNEGVDMGALILRVLFIVVLTGCLFLLGWGAMHLYEN